MTRTCPTRSDRPASAPVTVLQCRGSLHFDPAPLAALAQKRGETAADYAISEVLEDLSRRLSDLQAPRRKAQFEAIPVPVQRIAAIAGQFGLLEVATAARHVAQAADQADGIALEATAQRLERAFDLALEHLWDYHRHL